MASCFARSAKRKTKNAKRRSAFGTIPNRPARRDSMILHFALYVLRSARSASKDLLVRERPCSHQLVGRVTAYQGDDG